MSVWERLSVSTPLNRTAATVTSRSSWLQPEGPKIHSGHVHADAPWPVIPVAGDQEDLAGIQYDRVKVIGYVGRPNTGVGKRGRWLVRCACGKYELRGAKAIVERRAGRCMGCDHHRHIQSRYSGEHHGKD